MKVLDDKITYIYCLADPYGDIKYVGKSNNPYVRYNEHLKKAKYKKYYKDRWVNSLLENNQKPELIILDSVPYYEFDFWEKFYIQFFKKIGCKLTNTAPGGEGGNFGEKINRKISQKLQGRIFSEQWKENIRQSKIGTRHKSKTILLFLSQRSGKNNSMYGIHRKKEWDENKRKEIMQIDIRGNKIQDWPSIADAVKYTKINRTSINYVLQNKRKTAGGFNWSYSNIYKV